MNDCHRVVGGIIPEADIPPLMQSGTLKSSSRHIDQAIVDYPQASR